MADYEAYTDTELQEAIDAVNAERYPERAAALHAEQQRRAERGPELASETVVEVPDYKSYTIEELEDALSTVRADKYPQRAQGLRAELELRRAQGPVTEDETSTTTATEQEPTAAPNAPRQRDALQQERASTEKWRHSIAWLQIVVGPLFAGFALYALSQSPINLGAVLIVAFVLALSALSLIAGLKLRNNTVAGYRLTFFSQALQVLVITTPVFSWNYTALGSVLVYVSGSGNLGISATLAPFFGFTINEGGPLLIGVDVIPIVIVAILMKAGGYRDAVAARTTTST